MWGLTPCFLLPAELTSCMVGPVHLRDLCEDLAGGCAYRVMYHIQLTQVAMFSEKMPGSEKCIGVIVSLSGAQ